MIVVFDVVGTLFSLDKIRDIIRARNLPPEMLPWWFARLLQTAMAATLSQGYLPFQRAAESSLRQVLAQSGHSQDLAADILSGLSNLAPWPDARDCLERITEEGHIVLALTNSSGESAEKLLVKAGLDDFFAQILSTDRVHACKPDPRPYRKALERANCQPSEACMVAAHGWDIIGAHAVGMRTIWIERLEKLWPFPGEVPDRTATDLSDVALQFAIHFTDR